MRPLTKFRMRVIKLEKLVRTIVSKEGNEYYLYRLAIRFDVITVSFQCTFSVKKCEIEKEMMNITNDNNNSNVLIKLRSFSVYSIS